MSHLRRRDLLLWPLAAGLPFSPLAAWAQGEPAADDWLEAVASEEALAWVNARSAEALALVEREPDFARRRKETLAALSASTNVPNVYRLGEFLYNHTTSARRPLGLWRRTTLDEYAKASPSWERLLDMDALAKEEQRNLTLADYNVHAPSERALLFLSIGGEDKVELREFDLRNRAFVADGFRAPTAKMWTVWFGPDELLIGTYTGPDSITTSGYPLAVRRWKRGTRLEDAPVILRGQPTDMSVLPGWSRRDGLPPATILYRRIRFFEYEFTLLRADGSQARLQLPNDAGAWLDQDWIVVSLRTAWDHGGRKHAEGSVLAVPLAQAGAAQPEAHVLLEGQPRRRLVRVEKVKDGFVLSYTDNLQPRLVFRRQVAQGFEAVPLPAPEFGQVMLRADRPDQDNRLWMNTQAPLAPQAMTLVDVGAPAEAAVRKTQPPAFDASGLRVQQFEARSADGTLVPYTVIGPAQRSGVLPTLLYGYGGFGISLDLDYQRLPGINWLQYGGVYVMAHIRGGGEFGHGWYQAAKGTLRQAGFDDFIAVAQDLVARGITEPKRLGIYGASNGGVLVTTVMVQRPELFGAVVSRVPLTDMLGFTRLFAGASWTEEYGDPAQPADRAVLARWSPYQNAVKFGPGSKAYPPILFIGNRNDDRVHPAHARKMVARLRALGHEKTWLYEETSGGHSGRSDPILYAQREALVYSFLRLQLAGVH